MPRLTRPLASLSARGIIGGRRQGYTRRLRFYVLDFPTASLPGGTSSIALTSTGAARISLFFLPFSMVVRYLATQWPAVATPNTWALAIYNETGNRRLISLTGLAAPTVTILNRHPLPAPVTLDPGAYWIAVCPAAAPVSMTIRATTLDSTGAYSRAGAEGGWPYSSSLALAPAGVLPASFSPLALTGLSDRQLAARLQTA